MTIIIILCGIAILLEVGVRFVVFPLFIGESYRKNLLKSGYWPRRYMVKVDDEVRFILRKNYSCKDFRINSHGFRGGELKKSIKKDKNFIKIALIGDSIPFGSGMANNKNIYSDLTESYLSVELQRPVKFINGAVPSYTIRQSYRRLVRDISPWNPGIIVAQGFLNEVSLARYLGDRYSPGMTWTDYRFDLTGKFHLAASEFSAFYNLFFTRSKNQGKEEWHHNLTEKVWEEITLYLHKIKDFLQERGISLVILDNPVCYSNFADNPGIAEDIRKYRYIIKQFCGENNAQNTGNPAGVHFLDLEAFDDDRTLFLDFTHFSAKGHRALAAMLSQKIIRLFKGSVIKQ